MALFGAEWDGIYIGDSIHFHISGAIGAALMPWWIHWFRTNNPIVKCCVSISDNAMRFVSHKALQQIANGEVWRDRWDEEFLPGYWRDGGLTGLSSIILAPASLDTLMRLSHGRADSPALMMMQIATCPIVIADSIPGSNIIVEDAISRLKKRANVSFTPRVSAYRAPTRARQESGFNVPQSVRIASARLAEIKSND
ncbi:CypD family RiPP peptide-cysteine decarboxylase [uncultured Corynebacterium sp.]|uniref:CypD family RiPP peptide-cysteine decarboxylase n=1 Tax=uncultured Corynebacterium sp. TaxID=159447 RepID=UPI0028055DD1|nr:CypD family RiPP peptide-cysteine decarboxylase [uncultured Corynebacterium sp.]